MKMNVEASSKRLSFFVDAFFVSKNNFFVEILNVD